MSTAEIDGGAFRGAFNRFSELVEAKFGHPFRSFDEGLAAVWESYKPRLRSQALKFLRSGDWGEDEIGPGAIVSRTIEAIEIQDGSHNNNLVSWQNRFGHANRDHRALLEAESDPTRRGALEALLFGLYHGGADEGVAFDALRDATGAKYPLLAYLFFLKDMDRFMPIQPTGFDHAFHALGIGCDLFSTRTREALRARKATGNPLGRSKRPGKSKLVIRFVRRSRRCSRTGRPRSLSTRQLRKLSEKNLESRSPRHKDPMADSVLMLG